MSTTPVEVYGGNECLWLGGKDRLLNPNNYEYYIASKSSDSLALHLH